jgi:hypothetical protein
MDFGDLEEYGFNVKSAKCGGKTCFDRDSFKNYDDLLSKGSKFSEKLGEEGLKFYNRASKCHPYLRDNVAPRVEGIFTMLPCSLCLWPCGLPCDVICWLIPCWNCFVAIPFDLFITLPWNTILVGIGVIVIFSLLSVQFILSLFGLTVNWVPGLGGFGIF